MQSGKKKLHQVVLVDCMICPFKIEKNQEFKKLNEMFIWVGEWMPFIYFLKIISYE